MLIKNLFDYSIEMFGKNHIVYIWEYKSPHYDSSGFRKRIIPIIDLESRPIETYLFQKYYVEHYDEVVAEVKEALLKDAL